MALKLCAQHLHDLEGDRVDDDELLLEDEEPEMPEARDDPHDLVGDREQMEVPRKKPG